MRRAGIAIMASLIGLVKPLLHVMFLAIIMGVAGYLCAIFLTVMAAAGILVLTGVELPVFSAFVPTLPVLFWGLAAMALLRGILHYFEQQCNHYIAFKVLAIIRHKVFAALRELCPAKLEGKDRGNLISVITSDIELLEVFYAHTISPIAIALLTSLFLAGFIGSFHPACGCLALCGYLVVGVFLPFRNSGKGAAVGMEYRTVFGELNGFILDSLRGLQETIQYGQGETRMKGLEQGSDRLSEKQERLKKLEGDSAAATGACITVFSFGMLFLTLYLYTKGMVGIEGVVLPTVAMMSSFGPTAALSSLSNNLNQTLACGERVLAILEETPQVKEVKGKDETKFSGAALRQVDFSYRQGSDRPILNDVTMTIPRHKIFGIHGRSGSGKSTILKLLMRFWDVDQGLVRISGKDIRQVNTTDLRQMESFVTQETILFHNSIAANIAVGKPGASRDEIMIAAKKASIHDFIMTLPQGYDTPVGELGDTLSGGERQRIGIARAFLHDAPLLLLDEPTSNLDSLNEGIILKALKEEQADRTVVLVSHRKSTMNIADEVFVMDSEAAGRKRVTLQKGIMPKPGTGLTCLLLGIILAFFTPIRTYADDSVGKVKVKFSVEGNYDNGLPEVTGEADNTRYSLDEVTTLEEYMEQWDDDDDDDDENNRQDNDDLLAWNATYLAMGNYSEVVYAVLINAADDYYFSSAMDRITVSGMGASCVRLERLYSKKTLVLFVKFADLNELAGTIESAVWTTEGKALFDGSAAWYELRLYQNEKVYGERKITGASGYDFRPLMVKSGNYHYQVRPVSSSGDTGEWVQSENYPVTEEMAAANQKQFGVEREAVRSTDVNGPPESYQYLNTGWQETGDGRYWYRDTDGSYPQQNWMTADDNWYFFDEQGYLLTAAYVKWGADTYYVDENGRMITEGKAPDGRLVTEDGKLRWPET